MRLTVFAIAAAAVVVIGATGCSTTSSVAQYKSSTENVIAIQDYVGKSEVKVKVGDFAAGPGVDESMWCRANGPITVGSGKTPTQFIRAALQEELFLAHAYSNGAATTIIGQLDDLKFSSVAPAYWEIAMTLKSSNGASLQKRTRYEFSTSWDALSACRNVADAFTPAVQEALRHVIADIQFKRLLGSDPNPVVSRAP